MPVQPQRREGGGRTRKGVESCRWTRRRGVLGKGLIATVRRSQDETRGHHQDEQASTHDDGSPVDLCTLTAVVLKSMGSRSLARRALVPIVPIDWYCVVFMYRGLQERADLTDASCASSSVLNLNRVASGFLVVETGVPGRTSKVSRVSRPQCRSTVIGVSLGEVWGQPGKEGGPWRRGGTRGEVRVLSDTRIWL